jgi:hypothetical protein
MRVRWAGHVACMSSTIRSHKIFVGKPGGKRRRSKWEDSIIIRYSIYRKERKTEMVWLKTETVQGYSE